MNMSKGRAFQKLERFCALWALVLVALFGCKSEDALILAVRAPDGTQAKSYSVRIQDRATGQIVDYSGVQSFGMPRDLSATPFRLGLAFDQRGDFLIHFIAANVDDVEALPQAGVTEPMLFYAGLLTADGVTEVDIPLLPVPAQFDVDRDHYPDGVAWRAQFPDADAQYHDHPEFLDCLDQDPPAGDLAPATLRAFDIHPMARSICNAQLPPAGRRQRHGQAAAPALRRDLRRQPTAVHGQRQGRRSLQHGLRRQRPPPLPRQPAPAQLLSMHRPGELQGGERLRRPHRAQRHG